MLNSQVWVKLCSSFCLVNNSNKKRKTWEWISIVFTVNKLFQDWRQCAQWLCSDLLCNGLRLWQFFSMGLAPRAFGFLNAFRCNLWKKTLNLYLILLQYSNQFTWHQLPVNVALMFYIPKEYSNVLGPNNHTQNDSLNWWKMLFSFTRTLQFQLPSAVYNMVKQHFPNPHFH